MGSMFKKSRNIKGTREKEISENVKKQKLWTEKIERKIKM